MRNGFKQIFIGFLFVFLKIHIIVDLLPDFIGYIFIYNGIKQIANLSSQSFEKLKVLSIILTVVSVPNFFLNDQVIQQNGWLTYYPTIFMLLKVILVYFLFELLKEVSKLLPSKHAFLTTNRMYYWYMTILLGSLFFQSFLMNVSMDIMLPLSILLNILVLVLEIAFLVYLRNMGKNFPEEGFFEEYV